MKTKIIIAALILFLTIGIVVATDVNNLKCPDGWDSFGDGNYYEIGDQPEISDGRNMMIMKYDDSCADFFENITDENYYVFKNVDNSYNYTDWDYSDEGCFEVVEIDGNQYLLHFSTNIENDYPDKLNVYESMLKFNELNNLKPIAV